MSARSTLNGRSTRRRAAAANTGAQPLDHEARPSDNDEAAPQPAAPGRSDLASGSPAAERDERRHQRAVAREGHGRQAAVKTGARPKEGETHQARATRRGRLMLGETVSFGLIGIVVVGLVVGAILGAVGAPGWVVGLLVAMLSVILSTMLNRSRRRS